MIRQDAIYNVDFAGFLTYAWGGNNMNITEAEQIQHEYYYRSRLTLRSEKPQWLSDSAINVNGTVIPLSWSQPLNWKGGVPNASGAEVNFWRTNTTSRTITLDGSKTAGKVTFDSAASYTISPGTGGSIVFNDTGSMATLTSNQGNHTIATDVQLVDSLTANINAGITLTVSGIVSGTGGLTKTGAGKVLLSNTNSYAGTTSVQQGTLQINNRFLADAKPLLLSTSASLELGFSGSPDIIGSLFIDGIAMPPGIWGAPGSVSQFTTTLIQGTGRLQVTNGPLLGDYNNDSFVDAADYVMWRKQFSAGFPPEAYVTWHRNFSESAGGGAGSSLESPVPENHHWSAIAVGVLMLHCVSNRRGRPPSGQETEVAIRTSARLF
jgi:autotransporter-associated beta strand protein